MIDETAGRARIQQVARSWIATPFVDNGEIKGRAGGVDCARFIKCVMVEAGMIADYKIKSYTTQWFLHQKGDERFLDDVSSRAKREIQAAQAKPGDVVLFKIGLCYGHGAIVVDPSWPRIIHATSEERMVVEGNGLQGRLGKPIRAPRFFSWW